MNVLIVSTNEIVNTVVLDHVQLELQRIHTLLCEHTDSKKLQDFFWFDRKVIYNLLYSTHIGETSPTSLEHGIWVNNVHIHLTELGDQMVISNTSMQIVLEERGIVKIASTEIDDVKLIHDGVVPILQALAAVALYDFNSDNEETVCEPVESEKDVEVEYNHTVRVGAGKRKSIRDIKDLIEPLVESEEHVHFLSTDNFEIWRALKNNNVHEYTRNGVMIKPVVMKNAADIDDDYIAVHTELWTVHLPANPQLSATPYFTFAHVNEDNRSDVTTIAKVIDAIAIAASYGE